MPLDRFICPDGVEINIGECLEQCRMGKRCLSLATLTVAGRDREWDGVPHVTNLLNGTMMEYLKNTQSYAIDPKSRAYSLLGSSHHKLLEETDTGGWSEMALEYGDPPWIQGTLDLLEGDGTDIILWDYKSWGSYKVAKALGIQVHQKKVYKTKPDLREETLQLNMYRIMVTNETGVRPDRLQIQATVRDGGTYLAKQRGITESIYIIPVPILPDMEVINFFSQKAIYLMQAMLEETEAKMCSREETWEYTRCKSFCDVRKFCKVGRSMKP